MIPEQFLKDLRERVDIVSVIGRHVDLRKSGLAYVGLCPFHSEKSPSFNVRGDKGSYRCYGCGAHGDAVKFLIEHQGMLFRDAVETLAREANMEMPKETPEDIAVSQRQERLIAVLERAQALYRSELAKAPRAMAYLRERGITDEMVERFGIGFAPSKPDFLRTNLKDVPADLLKSAGLTADSLREGARPEVYEPMRGRVTLPIRSASGKIIAFGGRVLQPDVKPKYKNTRETELFKKFNELFGYYEAANEIRKKGVAIVVEGYVDVVVPSGHGVRNVVAPMGTALSKNGILRLFRAAKTIILCFDPDKAGMEAAVRSMENCVPILKAGHTVRFAFLPNGLDPDEFVIKFGGEAFETFLANSDPLSKFLIATYSSRNDMSTVEGRAQFAAEALALVRQIEDPILKAVLEDEVKLAARIGIVDAQTRDPQSDPTTSDAAPTADVQQPAGGDAHGSDDAVPDYVRGDAGLTESASSSVGLEDLPDTGFDFSDASTTARAPAARGDVLPTPGRRARGGFGDIRSRSSGQDDEPGSRAPDSAIPRSTPGAAEHHSVQDTPVAARRRVGGFAAGRQPVPPGGTPAQPQGPGEARSQPQAPQPSSPAAQADEQALELIDLLPVPESYRRRGFAFLDEQRAAAVVPARSLQNSSARGAGENHVNAPDASANDVAAELASVFVAEPIYAGFVDPDWLCNVAWPEAEASALRAMVMAVREYNLRANADGARPISREQFFQALSGGPAEFFVQKALSTNFAEGEDLERRFAQAIERLVREYDGNQTARYRPS